MEVEIISRETIKPSSPTAPHLTTFKISLIDRIFPKWYVPFIIYYAIKDPNESPAERFKRSLAETLTRFYPLAGRPNDDHTIDCNDKGVLFLTVRVKCHLVDVLKEPKIEEFNKLVAPWPLICPEDSAEVRPAQIGVQLNVFECGGVALSVCISPLICDAVTITAFLKCWSEISRGSQDQVVHPCFPAAELFPQGDEPIPAESCYIIDKSLLREGKGVIRRFVFDGHAIAALRDKARSERVPNPTRVEAVSMFIWKHCMVTAAKVWGTRQVSLLNFTVDLRRRMVPPLSEYSVGNIIWKVMTRCGTEDKMDINGLVSSFRTAMEEDMENIIPKLKNNGGRAAVLKYIEELGEICCDTNLNPYNMTSWCRMGVSEIDFGWGKPAWVSYVGSNDISSLFKNAATLIDGEAGEKIELWLILDHREMVVLENDLEFLAFASPNPPILI